ncbi:MAG: carbonic anhydrase [Sphingobacteriales bacterium]|nr:MAG: carbonic anhydrase [Sphingobacteriales bacterium]
MRSHDLVPNSVTPAKALDILKKGNHRFINNLKVNRNLLEQVNETKDGQWPFAAILSCMDSRTSAELVFDQGLGDVFSIRIAGNVISENVLGSLEYATAAAGSKLIVVLGHSNCGAIKGACDHVKMGHLTTLLDRIQPAVENAKGISGEHNSSNPEFVQEVAKLNVLHTAKQIVESSPIIKGLVEEGKVGIAPGMYDIATGIVTFYESDIVMTKEQMEEVRSAQMA